MNNKLTVFINDEKIGIVEFGMQSPVFSYTTSNNKKILSLSMKDMTKKYGRIFKYFIENLRLEDKDKQKCISLKSKISFDDYYNYFKKFGLDCAGAIKFIDESDNEDTLNTISNTIREIDDSNIEKKILDDINNVNVENELQHCSLAGYQPKILLLKKENKWYLSNGIIPTTHIIKPGISKYVHNSLNEYICLAIYRRLGIDAAESEYKYFNNTSCIVVKRYDRIFKDGNICRRHQEDMCQALGISFEDKYKVSSTDIIELLKNNSGKNLIKNVYGFCKALFLANIVGSVDGHAKNYSILLDDDVILAPIYDVFSCYGKEYKTEEVYKTAMKIGDNDIIGTLSKKDVIKFAKKNKLDVELLLDGLKEICEKLPNVVEKVFSDNSSIKELMEFKDIFIYNVKKNAKKILTDL